MGKFRIREKNVRNKSQTSPVAINSTLEQPKRKDTQGNTEEKPLNQRMEDQIEKSGSVKLPGVSQGLCNVVSMNWDNTLILKKCIYVSFTVFCIPGCNEFKYDWNDYTFIKELGTGASGSVFLYELKKQKVAIKMIHRAPGLPQHSEMFLTELKILESSKSPFIIQIFGYLLSEVS